MAPARLQSKSTRLVTRLLDHQHSELYVEREQLLRSPSCQHRVNCFEKSDNSPSAMVGSSFEHEGFCTRSSFEHCEQQSNCKEGAKAIPTKFHVGCPTSSCAKEKVAGPALDTESVTACSETSLEPVGKGKRKRWKSRGG